MAMAGVDVSSYQSGATLSTNFGSFAIVKATQADRYVNPAMAKHLAQARAAGMLTGVYHFANNGTHTAAAEADHFITTVSSEIGKSILVLDWEDENHTSDVAWAKAWLDRVKAKTGIAPMIYMSASVAKAYSWDAIAKDYGLWVAGYLYSRPNVLATPSMPYKLSHGWTTALYQYTSTGRVNGYAGNLDMDVAYLTTNGWKAYASKSSASAQTTPKETTTTTKAASSTSGYDRNKAAAQAVTIARDWSVGYSQPHRHNLYNGGETDCSAMTSGCVNVGYGHGLREWAPLPADTWTGNIRPRLVALGWTVAAPRRPKLGDVLLYEGSHVAMCVADDGTLAEAWADENWRASGGKTGDQTGNETRLMPYGTHPDTVRGRWTHLLIPPTTTTTTTTETKAVTVAATDTIEELLSSMKATHIIFNNGGAVHIADVLAGTYETMPSASTLAARLTVLKRSGAVVKEWHELGAKSNDVDDVSAFGVKAD